MAHVKKSVKDNAANQIFVWAITSGCKKGIV